MKLLVISILIVLVTFNQTLAQVFTDRADWSQEAKLPGEQKCFQFGDKHRCFSSGDRSNIYQLRADQLHFSKINGAGHAVYYPVKQTQLQIPYNSMKRFFEDDTNSPLRKFFYKIAKRITKFKSFDDTFKWIGLPDFPQTELEQGPNFIPKNVYDQSFPMGIKIFNHGEGAKGLTFGCAACHSADLFGVKVLGMTNRFPKGNEFIHLGLKVMKSTPRLVFKSFFKAPKEEMKLFDQTKQAVKSIGMKRPIQLGLDTSLAQVGLSLAKRELDEYATPSKKYSKHPRKNQLEHDPADSKPAVWWNLKYKTRWLSDGSIVSGNPIHTNFLWNEIGRGIDLKVLEQWFKQSKNTIQDLTSYVFSTSAPRFNDFFPRFIDIKSAKRGEKHFLKSCAKCHGVYEKGWSQNLSTYEEQIKTTKVWYHTQTPVKDVGTDPYRYRGIHHFAQDLNRLKISQTIGTKVVPQKGYVPPPLVGIWARYPYFHNNSVPTLMEVLTPASKRVSRYRAVPAQDRFKDFDLDHVGYPQAQFIRAPFNQDKKYLFDTSIKGLSNKGHSKMLLNEDGSEKYTRADKLDLIEFLKTL